MWLCEGGLRAGLQVIGCRLNPLNLQVACQHSTVDRKGNRRMRRKERSLGKVLLFCVLWFVVECGRYVYIRVSFRGKDALSCSTRHTGHPPPPLLCGKPECLCISMHVYGFMHAGCLTPARLRLFLNQSCHYRGREIIWGQTNFFPAVSVCKCVYIYAWSHIYCMSTFKCVCVCVGW